MPRLLDPKTGVVREVSEAEYHRLWDTEEGGLAFRLASEPKATIRLWDNVDGTWTSPLPQNFALAYYIRKVVSRCTGCAYTSIFGGYIARHLQDVRESAISHENAKAERRTDSAGRPYEACSACAVSFVAKQGRVAMHIRAAIEGGPSHRNAQEVLMLRFSLGPPAPGVGLPVSTGANGNTGPEASQVVGSGEANKRRRHRRRSRGRHGH